MNAIRQLCIIVLIAATTAGWAYADGTEPQASTVLGPRNPNLSDGASELLAGNAEEGIRLTKLGLAVAVGQRERQAGLGNICAGYVMLGQYETALEFCNTALSENERNWRALCNRALIYLKTDRFEASEADLIKGEEIAPNASALKEVRGMFMDATQPVTPNIVIDDRRGGREKDES
ncbi:MAG: tetratricopeptide repeat protein [Woeseiaceae bacterium]|nr:tetratricopeptide repeat protein [Woeseiaceae bacterium]